MNAFIFFTYHVIPSKHKPWARTMARRSAVVRQAMAADTVAQYARLPTACAAATESKFVWQRSQAW